MNQPEKNKLEHPCFPQPNDGSIKVWRYLDTSKLVDILSRRSLFFSRLDFLGDTHEGSITRVSHVARQAELEKHGMANIIPMLGDNIKKINKFIFVNCWYYDNHESEAMWKLYCPDNKGVAIQTTYERLVKSVDYDKELFIGAVKYIDYQTEWFPSGNIFYPVMHKRKAFQHEKEIRLVKIDPKYYGENPETPPSGIYCKWDMENFADNIYVNPYSQSWYYEIIKDLISKYGYRLNIEWSTIKGEPYY